ncbi:MAG: hypothetical protein QF464_21210, partial [Myxococcota bacterium]|nr:hypothetical protein [Myxococcota bacterium]
MRIAISRLTVFAALVAFAITASACGTTVTGSTCEAGEEQACECDNTTSTQVCGEDGEWADCDCPAEGGDATGSDTQGSGVDATGSGVDVMPTDVGGVEDVGPPDAQPSDVEPV